MPPRPVIEYYLSIISSWSYIGSRRFQSLIRDHNIHVIYKPIDIMRVFSLTGGIPVPQRSPARKAYRLLEFERWKRIRDIPLNASPRFFPADPSLAHRVLLAAVAERGADDGVVYEFLRRCQEVVWVGEGDVADVQTVRGVADAVGLDGEGLVKRAMEDEGLKSQEERITRQAVERGIFGAPTFVYQGEPFWGQDRIEFLEEAIKSGREGIPYKV